VISPGISTKDKNSRILDDGKCLTSVASDVDLARLSHFTTKSFCIDLTPATLLATSVARPIITSELTEPVNGHSRIPVT
jgi:hypothetical protein